MANTTKTNNRTGSQKRNTSSHKKSSAGKSKTNKQTNNRNREIYGILCMALGIIFAISLFAATKNPEDASIAGVVGGFFIKIATAVAGKGKFLLPVALLFWGCIIFGGKQYAWLGKKSLGLFLLFTSVLGFYHLNIPMTEMIPFLNSSLEGVGGGFLGGVISFLSRKAFGYWGSIVILLAFILIGLLLLTGISLSELFASFSKKARETAAEIKKAEAEEERIREIEKARQMELKKQLLMTQAASAEKDGREIPSSSVKEDFSFSTTSVPIIDHTVQAPVITEAKEHFTNGKTPEENAFAKEFLPKLSAKREKQEAPLGEGPVSVTKTEVVFSEDKTASVAEENMVLEKSASLKTVEIAADSDQQETKAKKETADNSSAVKTADNCATAVPGQYVLPSPELLTAGITTKSPRMNAVITENIGKLEQTLKNFGIAAKVTQVVAGPAVVRYELQPAPGVKVSRIVNLSDDIALGLAATQVRIEAPVPGKSVVGIEVPKGEITTVYFRDVIESDAFQKAKSKISVGFGKDISGDCLVGDLAKMPHLMIAGATGSGKSVCINTLICSILYKATPKEVKFLLVDPKKVELSQYAGLPHLIAPVVTDPKKAAAALKWVVNEMENRYSLFAGNMVKDFERYNELHPDAPLPQIVVLIDELADLMMVAARDVEDAICRLAQMARAAGIHLVIATQRPSVDVITGLIKANIPSRIAFAVSSQIDSRTILDMAGAERLLGKGDMLYYPAGMAKPLRVQGAIIFEQDIQNLVNYCKEQCKPEYLDPVVDVTNAPVEEKMEETDPLFMEAVRLVLTTGQASTSFLQRRMRIGNPRAGRLIDIMEQNGIVGPSEGAKARNILITQEDFEERFGNTAQDA